MTTDLSQLKKVTTSWNSLGIFGLNISQLIWSLFKYYEGTIYIKEYRNLFKLFYFPFQIKNKMKKKKFYYVNFYYVNQVKVWI